MPSLARSALVESAAIWEDLVVSILSVNSYSIEKAYALLPLLRKVGIVDPSNLGDWEFERVAAKLKAAGCDRGPFLTGLFAIRLASLGEALKAKGFRICEKIILSNDPEAIRNLLLPVNGIGPKVLENFFFLRGISKKNRIWRCASSRLS